MKNKKTKAMVLAIFVVAIMLTSVFPMVTADGGWCYEPVSKPDNGTNVDSFLIAEPGLVQTQLFSTFAPESQLDEQDVINPPIRKSFVQPRKSVGDAEDIPLVEAEGSYTKLLGPEYAYYTEEWWWSLRFDIYGGAVNGDGRTYADILGMDEEGNYILDGKIDIRYKFTGTYPGGLTESFADGAIEGTVSGTMDGVPFSGTAVGTWTGQVDGEAGTITGEAEWTLTMNADIGYPRSFDIDLDFVEPLAIKPIAEIEFAASPSKLGVIELGTYCADFYLMAFDADGNSLSGRRISMATDPGGKLKAAELDKAIVITDEGGFARNKLCVEVGDIDALPYEAPIYLVDELTPDGNWKCSYTIERAVLEVSITSPQDEWEADTETFEVSGTVEADDLSKVSLIATVIPGDKEAEYDCSPEITVDAAGSFSFPVSLLTPDMWYTILVEVRDESDHTHSTSIKVYYAGSYYLDIETVEYPDWVNPGDKFEVNVTVRYATAQPDQLTMVVTVGDEEQRKTVDVGPTLQTVQNKVARPSELQVQTETYTWSTSWETTTETELGDKEVTVWVQLIKSGNEIFEGFGSTEVRPVDSGLKAGLTLLLSYPTAREASVRYKMPEGMLIEWKGKNIIMPRWPKEYGNSRIPLKATFSLHSNMKVKVTNIIFEITGEVSDSDYSHSEEELVLTEKGERQEVEAILFHSYLKHGQVKGLPVGRYTARLFFDVEVINDEGITVFEEYKTVTKTFEVKEKDWRIEFKHTTIGSFGSRSMGLSPGSFPQPEVSQGNMTGGTWNPGFIASGDDVVARVELDWEDPDVDFDLHIMDPEGHILGADYARNGVRNTISGASYSGPGSKPEVVEFTSVKDGNYYIAAYARMSDHPATSTITIEKPTGICGDVNGDDVINIGDVTLLLNHWGDPVKYPLCNDWAGDVNSDDVINIGDVTLLLNHWGDPVKYPLNCG